MSARLLLFRFTTQAAAEHSFDFEGGWDMAAEPVYRVEDATGKKVEEVRNRWEIRGLLVSPDGTSAKGWDAFHAFHDAITGATGDPVVKVELIRDPDGEAVAELTLDDANEHLDLRVESVRTAKPSGVAPRSIYRTVFPLEVVVTTRKIGAAIGAGEHVTWDQEIERSYVNGLLRLRSTTTVTTREGVDAVAKARAIASLPLPGASYCYKTGNTADANGVDVVELDPDTSQDPDRTVTRVIARCVIEQQGVSVGNTGPGTAPDEVYLEDQTSTSVSEGVVRRTKNVAAAGPGAKAWCRGQKPSWAVDEDARELAHSSGWAYTWTATERQTGAPHATTSLVGELTGGGQVFDFEPVPGGYYPVRFDGPLVPWRFTLRVMISRQGSTGAQGELPFPPLLPAPWILDRQASAEGSPVKQDPGVADAKATWTREATLAYVSPGPPPQAPMDWLREQNTTVATYLLVSRA